MTVTPARGGAHGDEDKICVSHGAGKVRAEAEATALGVALYKRLQPRFIDRDAALAQGVHAIFLLVHTGDFRTKLCKAGAGHQTHIACSYHYDVHCVDSLTDSKG